MIIMMMEMPRMRSQCTVVVIIDDRPVMIKLDAEGA